MSLEGCGHGLSRSIGVYGFKRIWAWWSRYCGVYGSKRLQGWVGITLGKVGSLILCLIDYDVR